MYRNDWLEQFPTGIIRISGSISFTGNPALAELDLASFARVDSIEITGNAALSSVELRMHGAYGDDIAVIGDVEIRNNTALTYAFYQAYDVALLGSLLVQQNPALDELVVSTEHIGGDLRIVDNAQLRSV